MPSCAIAECGRRDYLYPEGAGMRFANGRWHCYICYLLPRLFPTQPARAADVQKRDRAELKPSKPKEDLSAPRAAAVALGRVKRRRVGPHR